MTDYYVDSAASAGGDGLSLATAWDTLADAVANEGSFGAGDTVHIYGTFNEAAEFTASGASGNHLRFWLREGAEISGAGLTAADECLHISGSYVTVRGDPDNFGKITNSAALSGQGMNLFCEASAHVNVMFIEASGSNFTGIQLRSCHSARVFQVRCIDNAVKGLVCTTNTAGAISTVNQVGVVLSGIEAARNGRYGIQLGGGNGREVGGVNRLEASLVYGNGTGVYLEDGDYWQVTQCRIVANTLTGEGAETGHGIMLENTDGAEIFDNYIDGNRTGCIENRTNAANGSKNKLQGLRLHHNILESAGPLCVDFTVGQIGDDNWIYSNTIRALSGYTANELIQVSASTASRIANNVLIGATDGVLFVVDTNQPNGWTVSNNIFDAQSDLAIQGGASITTFTAESNAYLNNSGNLMTIQGQTWTTSNIGNKDAGAVVIEDATGINYELDERLLFAGTPISGINESSVAPIGIDNGYIEYQMLRRRYQARVARRLNG